MVSASLLALTAQGVHAQQGATELETITVQGGGATATATAAPVQSAAPVEETPVSPELPWGPVDGYVATRTQTGVKTDTPLKEIPQSISVVTRDEIEDQGAQTLQDTLRYTAGVVADGYGIDSRTDSSIIRGTIATEYLDGLRRTFDYYIYSYRTDPYFMERIEVLRGPASVLYGQSSVGGIINSVSKRPQQEKSGEVTVEYGTFDYKQTKFDFTGPLSEDGTWSYRITGLGREAGTQVDFVDDDRLAIQPAITWQPSERTSLTLLAHLRRDHTGSTQQFLPHVGTIFPNVSGNFIPWERFIGEPEDKYDTDVASGTVLFEHAFNDVLKLQHSMRYSDIHNVYNSTYPGFFATGVPYVDAAETQIVRAKLLSDTDTQIFNSDTNLTAEIETGRLEHKILAGFDYSDFRADRLSGQALNQTPFDVYNPTYGQPENLLAVLCNGVGPVPVTEVPICGSDQHVTQTGFYAQDQIRLGNWIAVLGARHDRLENGTSSAASQSSKADTYRAGLMYEFANGFTPYASYAESFIPVVGTTFGGAPFDPREGVMYEAGFKYQPAGRDFIVNGAVYDLVESNRLAGDPANPGFRIQSGEASVHGLEIEGVGKLGASLTVRAGYSYTAAKYTGGDQKGFRVESVPEHLASLWLVRDFSLFGREGFKIGGGVRYVGSSWDGSDSLRTPSYLLYDAMFAYENDDWRLQLTGTNLADEEYLTTCLARGDCFRGTSRTIVAGVTRKF